MVSAALQDAILLVGDIRFDRDAQTLMFRASRYMHEQKSSKRVSCGVQFNNVLSLTSKNIDRSDPKAFLVLLSIVYGGGKKNLDGDVKLVFSGGGEMRLKVEYVEARLVDYLQERDTDKLPLHPQTNL